MSLRVITYILVLFFWGSLSYGKIRINEVIVSNLTSLEDKSRERYDWIELYNDSNFPVDISGYYLSDDSVNRTKWQFGSCNIAANDYLLVWASDKDIYFQAEHPQNISGLSSWFSASDIDVSDQEQVKEVNGKSILQFWNSYNNENQAFQEDTACAPTVVGNAIFGHPAVRFDGENDFLDSDVVPPLDENERTIIVVIANTNTTTENTHSNNYILHYGGSGTNRTYGILFQAPKKGGAFGNGYYNSYAYGEKSIDSDFHTISAIYDGTQDQLFVDRSIVMSNKISLKTGSTEKLKIASKVGSGKDFFGGDIAEILVYNRALNPEERDCIEGYFIEKYGLSKKGNHTNFKLSSKESVFLSNSEGETCDSIMDLNMPDDWSKGVNSDGEITMFTEVTPLNRNASKSYKGTVEKPYFSHKAGFYSADISLEITADRDAPIYYTLDGSVPTKNSLKYSQPLRLSDVSKAPNRLSLIQTTLEGEGFDSWNAPDDTVYKFNIIRARIIKEGYYPGEIETHAYVIDEDAKSRFKYPIVSLVSDSLNFFDHSTGIYIAGSNIDSSDYRTANFAQSGDEWERPVNIEVFDNEGELQLNQDAGVRIHGNFTRTANIKSLRFYARKEYGDSDFDYQFFKDKEQDSYKRFILRNSGNDYAWGYMRDVLIQNISNNLPFDTQNSQISEVFLNGEFWGLHYMRERYDRFYLKENYGLDDDEVEIVEDYYSVVDDDENSYKAILKFIGDNDMSDSTNYAYLKTKMDCENFIYYIACNWFCAQNDWPQNNYKYWRKKTDSYQPDAAYGHDGRWRCMMFDTDYGFGRIEPYTFNIVNFMLNDMTGWSVIILQNLIGSDTKPGNAEFRTDFINTLADLMNANFKEEYTISKIDSMVDLLSVKMEEHIQRWGSPKKVDVWERKVDVIREFALNRPDYMRQHMIDQFDETTDTVLVTINTDARMGSVKVNRLLINSATRGISNPEEPFPWNGIYFKGLPITLTAIAKSGYEFVEWKGYGSNDTLQLSLDSAASVTAVFAPIKLKSQELIINEHLISTNSKWVELFNTTNKRLVLDGYYLVNGNNSYQIENTVVDSGEYVVICCDAESFREVYDLEIDVIGDMSFKSAIGDALLIKSENGELIDSVKLDSQSNPTTYSIERKGVDFSNATWQSSYNKGGTPGHKNSTPGYALVINEVMAKNSRTISTVDGAYEDWIEIYNPLNFPIDMSGLYISDKTDAINISKSVADKTIIKPKECKLFWADKESEKGCDHLEIKLSSEGERIVLLGDDGKFVIDSLSYMEQLSDVSLGRSYDAAPMWKYFLEPTPNSSNGAFDSEISDGPGASEEIKIYPNPAKTDVTIVQNGAKGIEIFDIYGVSQNIRYEKKEFGFVVDASGCKSGVYLLSITLDDKIVTKKLVVGE